MSIQVDDNLAVVAGEEMMKPYTNSITLDVPSNMAAAEAAIVTKKFLNDPDLIVEEKEEVLVLSNAYFSSSYYYQLHLTEFSKKRRLSDGKSNAAHFIYDMIRKVYEESTAAFPLCWINDCFGMYGESMETRSMQDDASEHMRQMVEDIGSFGSGFGVSSDERKLYLCIDKKDIMQRVYGIDIHGLDRIVRDAQEIFDNDPPSPVIALDKYALESIKKIKRTIVRRVEKEYTVGIWNGIAEAVSAYGFELEDADSNGIEWQTKYLVPAPDTGE